MSSEENPQLPSWTSSSTPPSIQTKATPAPAPEGMGTGLFASTDIKTGEAVVYAKSPFVAVLDTPRLEDTCSGCFGRKQLMGDHDDGLKACTGCQVVRYCDKACQAKDWKFAHSLECPIFQKLKPRILPNNARAVLRVVLRSGRRKYDDKDLAIFLELETHARKIHDRNKDQWNRIHLSATAVKEYSGTNMKKEAISVIGAKLDLNSFNFTNALYDRIGLYFNPFAALINHSCDYNSVVGFDGEELFVKAIRPIKRGEQILISYIDTTNSRDFRQRELSERYFFECQCSKCSQEVDLHADGRLAVSSNDSSAQEDAEKKARSLMDSAAVDMESLQAVNKLQSAMHILHEMPAWSIIQQPYVTLRDVFISSLLSTSQFNKAFIHAAIRYIRVDPFVYLHAIHPIRQVHAWALAKLAILLSQGAEINTYDSNVLQKGQIDFGLILWSILYNLVSSESESCTVPSFKGLVRSTFHEVHAAFITSGMNPKDLTIAIGKEWEKLESIVHEELEQE